ncbi:MAG: hypothetical protein AAF501_02565 [Pseudomonadota bacterium]
MNAWRRVKWVRAAVMLGLGAAISGCAGEFGESGLADELARVKVQNGFAVLARSTHHAEIAAQGKRIHIETAEGFCIADGSLDVSSRGVFALIADCVTEDGATQLVSADDELVLPPSFPGIMTVSITGESGFVTDGDGDDLEDLEDYLKTREGRTLLGRGGAPDEVEIMEIRRIGDARYVFIRDRGPNDLGVLAKSFWRAFLPVNSRMLLVTISGFAARPVSESEMLEMLALQVTHLRTANKAPVYADEVRLAKRANSRLDVDGSSVVAEVPARATDAIAPLEAPRPVPRGGKRTLVVLLEDDRMVLGSADLAIASETAPIADHVASPESKVAPVRAPAAVPRPG